MNNIRNFRERFGLTQEDLAKVLGCTRGAVCHYETGRTVAVIYAHSPA
ncbi:helix-turn-helix transcriptional regulator [Salmonella enterica]|nr:helix-turn-helix transcriptional regulator [Salmonella enterica]